MINNPVRELTITVDVEDPRPHTGLPQRYDRVTREILDMLASVNVRATFFIVGELAVSDPELIQQIAAANHEVALHGLDHTPLTQLTPAQFSDQAARGKALIEDLVGRPVVGFRAPIFSLTPSTVWAESLLTELGFAYSSSLLPGKHPFFSFSGAPATIFRWPSGLLEIPSPLASLGPLNIPYLGGIYFRYLPYWFIRRCLNAANTDHPLWLYCHPHDFDHTEPFYRIKNTPYWMSLLLWMNRKDTMRKLNRLLTDSQITIAKPFADQLESGMFKQATTFYPPTATTTIKQ